MARIIRLNIKYLKITYETGGFNMFKISANLAMLFALSGCSMTLPVQGVSTNDSELFTGTATGYLSGKGDLNFTSNMGRTCTGTFKYNDNFDKGVGGISCNDGSQGDFVFYSSGVSGHGFGNMNDGTRGQFLFGDLPSFSQIDWNEANSVYKSISYELSNMLYYCDDFPKTPKCSAKAKD